jgi:hypothetical protein
MQSTHFSATTVKMVCWRRMKLFSIREGRLHDDSEAVSLLTDTVHVYGLLPPIGDDDFQISAENDASWNRVATR